MNITKIRTVSAADTPVVQYVVQDHDTLCSLAVRFHTSASCLRSVNGRVGFDQPLVPGMIIKLPASDAACEWIANHPECAVQNQQTQKQPKCPFLLNENEKQTLDEWVITKHDNQEALFSKVKVPMESQSSPSVVASIFKAWTFLSRPMSIEDAQTLGWTFLDAENAQPIQPGRSSLPLPRLLVPPQSSEHGFISDNLLLTNARLGRIVEVLPPRAEGHDLCLLFSTNRHGHSLRTLYEISINSKLDPATCCLLLVSLPDDTLLGAFLPCPVRPPSLSGCYGTGETLVFRCRSRRN